MKIYKIRNPEGLFSSGGMFIRFTKKGKSWKALGHIKTHLAQFKDFPDKYKNCEIVEIELIPKELGAKPIKPVYDSSLIAREIKRLESIITYKKSRLSVLPQEISQEIQLLTEDLRFLEEKLKKLQS